MTDEEGPDGKRDEGADDAIDVDEFYDVLESVGRPVVTASEVARALGLSQAAASEALTQLSAGVENVDVEADPVVWYPTDWREATRRQHVVVFPKRREVVVDRPEQFTRAQLSQFATLVTTNGEEGYVYEVREEDVWNAPYGSLADLLGTVRRVLGEHEALEEFVESQWERARKFRLFTHEDGYVVLEARSDDLMGNIARQKLDESVLRAPISDTESWVAEEKTAELKRTLYEAGYPVQDDRDLERGDPLDAELELTLRDYQREWVDRFLEAKSGVLVGPPGSGKTVAALGILAAIGGETLILVPSRELAAQWRDQLLEHTTLGQHQVGEYHGGEKVIAPVTIATYHTAGMARHRALFDERRWGLVVYDECLSPDTVLETPEGRTTFRELDQTYGFDDGWNRDVDIAVLTFCPDRGKYEWTDVDGVYRTTSEVHRIEVETGQTMRATPEHTHLVFEPETATIREQRGVKEGDYLIRPSPTPSHRSPADSRAIARAELTGWFIGDGHMNEDGDGKFSFARRAAEPIGIIECLCDELDIEYSVYENPRKDLTIRVPKLAETLRWEGAESDKANTVRVPAASYRWADERIGALLRGLYDANGFVDQRCRIQFNTTSEWLASDVALLLQKLGITTRRVSIDRETEDNSTVYQLTIPSFYSNQFEEWIGFRLEAKSERIEQGSSPRLGGRIGSYLESLGADLGASNDPIDSMVGVSGRPIGDVVRSKYRLGKHRLDALVTALEEYAAPTPTDRSGARKQFDVSYEGLGTELGTSTGSVHGRPQQDDREAISAHERLGSDHQDHASEHAERLAVGKSLTVLEVTDVEVIGTGPVYDLETGTHDFLADGFLTHNCQHIPTEVFRRSTDLQSRHRLGLSASPVREDEKEEEIFTLVGPPIGTDWSALFDAGYVMEPEVEIRYVPWAEEAREAYGSASGQEKRQLAATNPAKVDAVRRLLAEHPGLKSLVFVEYLDQGRAIADAIDVPFVSGEMRHAERERRLADFREGRLDTLVVSRVADEGLDLPEAGLAIVASGLGGSRRQGTQRAGRTMRPAGNALVYVLATRGTREEDFARNQLRHLSGKGVRVTEGEFDLE